MLRAVLGPDAAGAVVEGEVERVDASGTARVRIGPGRISVPARARLGRRRVRVQVRASEVVAGHGAARGLAQANLLEGEITGRGIDGPGPSSRRWTWAARVCSRVSPLIAPRELRLDCRQPRLARDQRRSRAGRFPRRVFLIPRAALALARPSARPATSPRTPSATAGSAARSTAR